MWNHDPLLNSLDWDLPSASRPGRQQSSSGTAPVASVLSCTTGIHQSVVEMKLRHLDCCSLYSLDYETCVCVGTGSSATLSVNCGRASRPCSARITTGTSTTQSRNCTCRTFTVIRTVWMVGAWRCFTTGTPTIRSMIRFEIRSWE